jgi:transcriptional regulator with GAF, ATPase, and Fis domain
MRPITGADVIDFHETRYDLLVLDYSGEFAHIDYGDVKSSSYQDNRASSYDFVITQDDEQVQVLLERSTIDEGEWFPEALDDEGDLAPSVADEMADIINSDGILPSRAMKAVEASKQWKEAEEETNRLALERAKAVTEVVAYCGGNQSKASRVLGLDQSTVNKLVRKIAQ